MARSMCATLLLVPPMRTGDGVRVMAGDTSLHIPEAPPLRYRQQAQHARHGQPEKGEGAIDTPAGTSRRGFAIPATPDLELAGTVAASAEELGYSSAWTNDAPPGDGLAMAGAMLGATTAIRVGVGAVPCDRRPPAGVAEQLLAASLPLERLVLVVGSGG